MVTATAEVTFTELRGNAKFYFDAVESGQSVRVSRNGKAIAEIVPIKAETPSWKREATPLKLDGLSLSRELLHDRDESA
ncbi:MAG: type II toxin-antitoxin system prevent-host-death family antitoxin [Aeromicrobium sp.]|nr:type II toxin-antitoxin system prevent-host-death family antitoxin [Burkholderiales bacterium]